MIDLEKNNKNTQCGFVNKFFSTNGWTRRTRIFRTPRLKKHAEKSTPRVFPAVGGCFFSQMFPGGVSRPRGLYVSSVASVLA